MSSDLNHLIDECLAAFSHEVRTPLSTILGWAQIIGTKRLKPEQLQLACRAIERGAHDITGLVCELSYLRSCARNGGQESPVSTSPESFIRSAVEEVSRLAEERRVSITVLHVADGAEVVVFDEQMDKQIIASLLAHAIRLTQPGKEVTVKVTRRGDALEVQVEGVGGEEGLHLAIARYLAELQGGTLSVKEVGCGRATLFVVVLPIESDLRQALVAGKKCASLP